jgi:hypothetical protein
MAAIQPVRRNKVKVEGKELLGTWNKWAAHGHSGFMP